MLRREKKKTILITRDREGNKVLAKRLKRRGVQVICWDTFKCVRAPVTKKLQQALRQLDRFDWVVFTSPRAVQYFIGLIGCIGRRGHIGHIGQRGRKESALRFPRVAAVGPATAKVLRSFGLNVAVVSHIASAKGLASERIFRKSKGLKIFFPCASDARNDFVRKLGQRHHITSCVVYRKELVKHTRLQIKQLLKKKIDQIFFYSPSAVRAMRRGLGKKNFIRLIRRIRPISQMKLKAVGPTTAHALKACLSSLPTSSE